MAVARGVEHVEQELRGESEESRSQDLEAAAGVFASAATRASSSC